MQKYVNFNCGYIRHLLRILQGKTQYNPRSNWLCTLQIINEKYKSTIGINNAWEYVCLNARINKNPGVSFADMA